MVRIWSRSFVWGSLIPPMISPQKRVAFLFEIYREILEQNMLQNCYKTLALNHPRAQNRKLTLTVLPHHKKGKRWQINGKKVVITQQKSGKKLVICTRMSSTYSFFWVCDVTQLSQCHIGPDNLITTFVYFQNYLDLAECKVFSGFFN